MAANWRSDRPRQEDNGLPLSDQCGDRPQCTTEAGIVYSKHVTDNVQDVSNFRTVQKVNTSYTTRYNWVSFTINTYENVSRKRSKVQDLPQFMIIRRVMVAAL
jgi:hypothetical protein